uniref:ABC-type multidrug transport system, ATPase component n=1 Tax=uncultured myxobacterium HF0200_01L06 TaxID=723556 RepID=E7C3I7_9BACT|nr:ABC-type multidrug transport system, ATPase component [uncultured myxobacterium HF0200_01L06]
MAVLELSAVGKRYGTREALNGVSLTLDEGQAVGLLGPNGAGKTTALRLLLGFCRPSSGRVRLRGQSPEVPASRRALGYLPEKLVLPGRMTVSQLLAYHAGLAGLSQRESAQAMGESLEKVGLADRAGERIAGLSKGLRQRLGFAQALLGNPTLLLLDEPTSGLDPIGIRDARSWIEEARRRGCSVLISSHGLSEVERLCDQVAILHEGNLAASGPLDDIVRTDESLEDAFVRVVRG